MTETGLLVAEVVFLVLLYLFVWSVVRSGGRQVEQGPPPRPLPPEIVEQPAPRAAPPAPEMAMAGAPVEPTAPPLPAEATGALEPGDVVMPAGDADDGHPEEPLASESGAFRRARARAEGATNLGDNLDPRLVVERSTVLPPGAEITLTGGMTIGRSSASGIPLADAFVSHMHARILRRGAYFVVEDLGSTNGTFLNDRRVDRDARLKMHDELRLGETVLRYEE